MNLLINKVRIAAKQAPQLGVSIVIHLFVGLVLLNLVMDTGRKPQVATVLSNLEEVIEPEEFDQLEEEQIDLDEPVSLTPTVGPSGAIASDASVMENPSDTMTESAAAVKLTDTSMNRPLAVGVSGMGLDSSFSGMVGTTVSAGGGGDTGGAISRITMEILRQLGQNKVVVAWVFDNSPSLSDRRKAIAERMDRVYKELEVVGAIRDRALLTAVVSAGDKTLFPIETPTDDSKKISEAIHSITDDSTGKENIFAAVRETALKYRSMQTSGRRTLMIILVTDEIGSDVAQADDTMALLQRNKARMYVLGPMSTFSINVIYDYQQIDGFSFQEPIYRGPYTRRDEILRVAFNSHWYKAGFGPFALVQMARESGGIFFIYDDNRIKGPDFDLDTLNRYRPNYDPPAEYLRELSENNLRRRLMDVVENGNKIWRQHWPDTWVIADNPTRSIESRARETAQFLAFADKALPILDSVAAEWETETNPRWQANFDLAYARLLKAKVQADEYAWALASMKTNPLILKDPMKNNGWHITWGEALHQGEKPDSKEDGRNNPSNKQAQQANKLIEKSVFHYTRILEKHPGTPWATAAAKERGRKVGANWKEGFNSWHVKDIDRKKYEAARKKVIKQ